MTSLNISLPESMRTWIDRQVKEGGYGTASEFVREILREAQKTRARRELEEKLIEGIESGPPITVTKEYWDGLRRRAIKRGAGAKRGRRGRFDAALRSVPDVEPEPFDRLPRQGTRPRRRKLASR